MSRSKPVDLALDAELPSDPAQAEASRAKAAALVGAFVEQQALPALDAVLSAADGHAPAPRQAVETATEMSRVVDAEVSRYRAVCRGDGD